MKAFTKILCFVCISAILSATITGCGNKSSSSKSESSKQTETQKTETKKPVTLRFSWWGGDARHKATLDAIKLYEERNPNVKVEGEYVGAVNDYRQKLFTQFAGGSVPDIMQIDAPWLPEIYKMGDVLTDLNQFKDVFDTSGFDKKFLESFCINDKKLLSVPTGINSLILTFNKDVLNKAGVKADQEWNWESFITEGKKVNQADKNNYFFNTDQTAIATVLLKTYIIQKTGQQFIKDDFTLGFEKADLVNALNYLNRLFAEKVMQPASEAFQYNNKYEQNPIWVNKQAGSILTWNSTIVMWSGSFLNSAEVTNVPVAPDAKNTGIMVRPAHVISISPKSADKLESAKFLNFFFNDKDAITILKDSRSIQPTEGARKICTDANLVNPLVTKAAEIAQKKQGLVYNSLSNNQEFIDIFTNTVEEVGLGKASTSDAADKMISRYNTKLKELKATAGK